MKRKYLIVLAAVLMAAVPIFALSNGENLNQALSTLRKDLRQDYQQISKAQTQLSDDYEKQHERMVEIMKQCNELSLQLYSQKQDFTFDLCYALENVTDKYNEFSKDRKPFDHIVANLDIEIERYARLIETLRRLPPERDSIFGLPDSLLFPNDTLNRNLILSSSQVMLEAEVKALADSISTPFILDEQGNQDRDQCIFYATELLKMYVESKTIVVADSIHYHETFLRLKETYDFARNYYQLLQNNIFIEGQTPWFSMLTNPSRYWQKAKEDIKEKYTLAPDIDNPEDEDTAYSLQILVVFFLIAGFLVLWLIVALLLIPVFRYIKPVKDLIAKGQRRYVSLLVSILIFVLITASSIDNSIFQKAFDLANTFMWLLAAIIAALLIRLKPEQLKNGVKLYIPTIFMALAVIGCRVVFMPNSLMNIFFPPIPLIFFCWQLYACLRHRQKVEKSDRIFGWISLVVTGIALIVAIAGYIFASLLILVWWYFQLATILTIITIWDLTVLYKEKRMKHRIDKHSKRTAHLSGADKDTLMFRATWFYDLIREVVLPVVVLMSFPFCLHLALNVFDFEDLYNNLYHSPFFQLTNDEGKSTFCISFYSIILLICLFFVFRYANQALHALYQRVRYTLFMRKHNRKHIRSNEINLSLANSIISVVVWMIYIIIIVVMLKIPTGSLSLVAGGLSAGIGLALKDVLNNFIYGIQLLSGRLRVGDWIECDGVRGKVTEISYQSTQIETVDGAQMSFLNATLFAKNFSNLTRNHSYEFLKITVGVAYGTEIQRVREVLLEALKTLQTKDAFSRDIVEPQRGVSIVLGDMDDNAVTIAIKQYVLVAERVGYIDRAKELIYNTLNENGIAIPFPQCDVHLIKDE
jgi:small-conductance mechanosensitive channel